MSHKIHLTKFSPISNLIVHGREYNYSNKLLVWPKLDRPDQWLHPCATTGVDAMALTLADVLLNAPLY